MVRAEHDPDHVSDQRPLGPESTRILRRSWPLRALGFTVEPPTDPAELAQQRRSSALTVAEIQAPAEPPTLTPELARVLLRILQRARYGDGAVPEARCQTDGVAS